MKGYVNTHFYASCQLIEISKFPVVMCLYYKKNFARRLGANPNWFMLIYISNKRVGNMHFCWPKTWAKNACLKNEINP